MMKGIGHKQVMLAEEATEETEPKRVGKVK